MKTKHHNLVRRILVLREMLSGIRTLQPQLLTIVEPQPRNRNHEDTQERKQTRSPLIAKFIVHLIGEEGKAGTHEIANEDHAGERGGGIGLVGVDDVVEDAEDDDVDAQAEEAGGNDGDDPVDAGEGCPCEPVRWC